MVFPSGPVLLTIDVPTGRESYELHVGDIQGGEKNTGG